MATPPNPAPKPGPKPKPKAKAAPGPEAKAPEKGAPKARKFETSRESLIHLGGAAALILLSIVFLWLALVRYNHKGHLTAALKAMDRNNIALAAAGFEAALSWKPSDPVARRALAKRLVDEGALDRAEALYKELLAEEPEAPATLNAALGVIALRRADQASEPKAFAGFLKAAREKFKAAGSLPEAEIGAKHVDLLEAIRNKNGAKIEALRADFAKLLAKYRSKGAEVTKEGFIDLYTGIAVTQSWGGRYSADASQAFNSCWQYAPQWPRPMINRVFVEAQKYVQTSADLAAIKRDTAKIDEQRSGWEMLSASGGAEYKNLREAWFQYSIALAYRCAEEGDLYGPFAGIVNPFKAHTELRQRPEVWKLQSGSFMRAALRGSNDPNTRLLVYQQTAGMLDEFLSSDVAQKDDKAFAEIRSIALNNRAVCYEVDGGLTGSPSYYEEAVRRLQEALKVEKEKLGLADGRYETNRNLAVILKRLEKAAEATAAYEAALKVGGASEDERIKADAAKLQRFWAGEKVD